MRITNVIWLNAGDELSQGGVYACLDCGEPETPHMVSVQKGELLPSCPACGEASRWLEV
jgi:ribosomal protein L32